MTLYGDLDVSVIDEMPPGRKPILTKHVTADHAERIYSFLKKQIDEGRQAYVVYPVIEESETQRHEGGREDARTFIARSVSGRRGGLDAWAAGGGRKGSRPWSASRKARRRSWFRPR